MRNLFGRTKSAHPVDLLVVGLGNPGREYEHTRHNAGADVVALLASRQNARLRSSRDMAMTAEVRVGDRRLGLAFPQTYMNESGMAVGRLVKRYGVEAYDRLIIVHDELDLPLGRLQVKVGGGLAGHNGLRSIRDHLKSTDFLRVRIGVGKPPSSRQGAGHVLSRPSKGDRQELDIVVEEAADAVELIATVGVVAAQARYNTRGDSGEP